MSTRQTVEATSPWSGRIALRRILCPVDGSELSDVAVRYATAVARWYGSEITGLHVLPLATASLALADVPEMAVTTPRLHDEAQRKVGEHFMPACEVGLLVETVVEDGDPASEILDLARALPADLIVMGTHGRHGFERWILGSVAEKVLRKASCPVLSISAPHSATVRREARFSTILCPTDLTGGSSDTLAYALSFAQEAGARLILVHVLDGALDPIVHGSDRFDLASYRSFLEERAMTRLRECVPDGARDWCTIEEVVLAGSAYRRIRDLARETTADLIVMSVHGGGKATSFFGSTATQIVRAGVCPVLTVRPTRRGPVPA